MTDQIAIYRAQDNDLVPLTVSAQSLDDATLKTSHGVYTVFRLYPDQQVFRLSQHLARMRRSAELLNTSFTLTDAWMRDMIRQAVDASGIAVPRVRITAPFDDAGSLIIALEAFEPPSEALYQQGVAVGIVTLRRENPVAKNSQFIEERSAIKKAYGGGAYELLMSTRDGEILEGLGSNFYAVKDGVLRTAGSGMLEGIARSLLLEVAPQVIPLDFRAPCVDELPDFSEAMLTSSSRAVLPIVKIGDTVIGDGKPGPVQRELRRLYDEQLAYELEPL